MYGLRVVLGDPNASQRNELKRILATADHLVLGEAGDGLNLVKLVRRLSPDLVLLSWNMPMMDGLEAAQILEEEGFPVILLVDYLGKGSKNRVIPYVVKPVNAANLFSVIDLVVGHCKEVSRLKSEIHKLKETLETRKVVEKAKGILMNSRGWNEDEAFRYMQKLSMDKRSSLKAVAEAILLTQ